MAMSVGNRDEADVMVEMNTTPLIDVMLVLLIMLIVTIPIQTHAVKLDMPVNKPSTPPEPPGLQPAGRWLTCAMKPLAAADALRRTLSGCKCRVTIWTSRLRRKPACLKPWRARASWRCTVAGAVNAGCAPWTCWRWMARLTTAMYSCLNTKKRPISACVFACPECWAR